jgi:aminobenzoyl-glutamate utilization protein B
MKIPLLCLLPACRCAAGLLLSTAFTAADSLEKKTDAVAVIERHRPDLVTLSDAIWRYAETAFEETQSSKALADYAEQQGFTVQRGVAGMPTAFIASFGTGKPILGIVAEFDALPGLSQKASSTKEPLAPGAAGHGCGHNLFGAGSLGAAVAIKELMAAGKLTGTVRLYGTPAEERGSGKTYMIRAGLFQDLDVCLAWHPSDRTRATAITGQSMVDFVVEFHGRAAHAASDPWNGRSALDGLESLTHGLNMLREHVKPTVRIHYTIVRGGEVPNVIPEYAKLWCWVRDSRYGGVEDVMQRVRPMVQGAGLMAGVDAKMAIQEGLYERLLNTNGIRLLHTNLVWLGAPQFTEHEQDFARALQTASKVKPTGLRSGVDAMEGQEFEGGSTDLGDVSYVVPLLHLEVVCAPFEAPWHAWPVVACGGMSIGHKGMIHAAKTLAATLVDLFESEPMRRTIRKEFEDQTQGRPYKSLMPDKPPPIGRAGGK